LWLAPSGEGQDLTAGTVLFELRFRVIGAPGSATSLSLQNAPTRVLACNSQREEIPIGGNVGQIEVFRETLPVDGWDLSVYPNPFRDRANLEITLPEGKDLSLQVFNAVGQLIYQHDAHFEAGQHVLAFDGQSLPAGVYYARLSGGPQLFVKELLLVK
jgi:hypothetical protein